jgi:hypothetical protein
MQQRSVVWPPQAVRRSGLRGPGRGVRHPEADDRHVLVVAVTAGASLLVTDNLDDFPAERIPEGLRVVSPDEFVLVLASDDLEMLLDVVESQAAGLVKSECSSKAKSIVRAEILRSARRTRRRSVHMGGPPWGEGVMPAVGGPA